MHWFIRVIDADTTDISENRSGWTRFRKFELVGGRRIAGDEFLFEDFAC